MCTKLFYMSWHFIIYIINILFFSLNCSLLVESKAIVDLYVWKEWASCTIVTKTIPIISHDLERKAAELQRKEQELQRMQFGGNIQFSASLSV